MTIWTAAFWQATAERVISSIAGGALAVIGADVFGVVHADWAGIASVAAGAGVVSLLKALAANATTGNGPSMTNAEKLEPDTTPPPAGYEPKHSAD